MRNHLQASFNRRQRLNPKCPSMGRARDSSLLKLILAPIQRLQILFSLLLLSAFTPAWADMQIRTISNEAFNGYINGVSFQQDAITTYNGFQYAVYWSANRHVAVARRALHSDEWETLELTDYRFDVDNAHYDISLGVSPNDGTLHLSFYQWSSRFNYRKSVSGLLDQPNNFAWTQALFGSLQHGLLGATMEPTTYPRFVSTPSGDLLLLLRHGESGAGDSYLYEYRNGSWTGLGKLVDGLSTNINAYFNGLHYDDTGRLHASWVWRATPNATTNFDLHYIYSDDDGRTWRDNNGNTIAITGRTPINQNTPGIRVWQIPRNRGLINQEAQAVDSEGRVSMLMSHMPDNLADSTDFTVNRHKARVFHYLRNLDGQWSRTLLPGSSFSYDRNKIAADGDNNLFAVINRDGVYRTTEASGWQDWELVQSINDQTLFAEVQIDRALLHSQNTLSFVHISNQGKFLQFEKDFSFYDGLDHNTGGGPEGYVFCAQEGETCQVPNRRDIAYGAAGQFSHRTSDGPMTCRHTDLDPIRGTVKRCYYSLHAPDSQGAPAGYQFCANEGQTCNVQTLSQVAYGTPGSIHYRLTRSAIACTEAEFGSPIQSGNRQCWIRPVAENAQSQPSSSSSTQSQSSEASSASASSMPSNSNNTAGGISSGMLVLLSLMTFIRTGIFIHRRRQN